MSRCRCGHIEADHRHDGGIFPTQRDTLARGTQCRRCDCPHMHTTTYKRHQPHNVAPHAGRSKMPLFDGGHQ